MASDDDPRITQAIGEAEFQRAIRLLEHHYNLVCLDTGTGVLESATRGILNAADQIVVVSAPSLDGARAASSTLDWLEENGHENLVRGAVAVLNAVRPSEGFVDLNRIEAHFASRCRACVRIPWDPHLEAGAEANLGQLRPAHASGIPGARRQHRLAASPNQPKGGRDHAALFSNLVLAATGVGGNPDPNGLPGSSALE